DDRRQRQEAQKERAQGDVANNPAFTENQRCYEIYAERLTLVRDLVVAVDENDFASPGVFESDAINEKQCVTAAIGILKHHASVVIFAIHPKQYHAAAMPEYDDCGQRLLKRRERTPFQMEQASFKPGRSRAFQQLRNRQLLAGQSIVMNELRRRKVETVLPGNDDKATKAT